MADITDIDIAWLAGLLEGEGCFHIANRIDSYGNKRIVIQLCMTDKDIVERAANLLDVPLKCRNRKTKSGKNLYTANVWDSDKAIAWMLTLYPYLGIRRQSKIRDCLAVWKNMPGRGKRRVGVS